MKHVRNSAEQIHRFEDGDETIVVQTTAMADGQYLAVEHENHDVLLRPFGIGFSTFGAIADLFEKLPRAQSEREERDLMAAKLDHARDLRKNWEDA